MFKGMRVSVLVVAGLALTGCASYLEGTDQTIPIYTNTASAICDVTQKGYLIASVYGQEGFVPLGKSREPLTVSCSAPGYEPKTVHVPAVTSETGALTYWIPPIGLTDWVAGGLNRYPHGGIAVALRPLPGQRAVRDEYVAEALSQDSMNSDYIPLRDVRPARPIPYPLY
jgi:hypothetical protein